MQEIAHEDTEDRRDERMPRYHLKDDGTPAVCRAQPEKCPKRSDDGEIPEHFHGDIEDARSWAEGQNAEEAERESREQTSKELSSIKRYIQKNSSTQSQADALLKEHKKKGNTAFIMKHRIPVTDDAEDQKGESEGAATANPTQPTQSFSQYRGIFYERANQQKRSAKTEQEISEVMDVMESRMYHVPDEDADTEHLDEIDRLRHLGNRELLEEYRKGAYGKESLTKEDRDSRKKIDTEIRKRGILHSINSGETPPADVAQLGKTELSPMTRLKRAEDFEDLSIGSHGSEVYDNTHVMMLEKSRTTDSFIMEVGDRSFSPSIEINTARDTFYVDNSGRRPVYHVAEEKDGELTLKVTLTVDPEELDDPDTPPRVVTNAAGEESPFMVGPYQRVNTEWNSSSREDSYNSSYGYEVYNEQGEKIGAVVKDLDDTEVNENKEKWIIFTDSEDYVAPDEDEDPESHTAWYAAQTENFYDAQDAQDHLYTSWGGRGRWSKRTFEDVSLPGL